VIGDAWRQYHTGLTTLFIGGPGGSGFSLLSWPGANFTELLGDDYDLIGFDPRGIGRTTFVLYPTSITNITYHSAHSPAVKCFPTYMDKVLLETNTVLEKSFTAHSNLSAPSTYEHLVAQEREFLAVKKAEAEMCARNMGPELAYMGTANVVRDMDFMTKVLEGEDALM
jgi:pimeloyl-ACP methyl ester carboxylesterase